MVLYRAVPPDSYLRVKKGLQNDHVLSQYPSFHDTMHESFEIISLNGKIAVYYYKDGTLTIEGNEKDPLFHRIIRRSINLFQRKNTFE